jgi:hypothetical protein
VRYVGGAATNSGIDFQSRVGALSMVSMFAEVDELAALGLTGHRISPTELRPR